MLTQLHIQNIAVIQKATIQLRPGLNVFTGETGAGKTMLISAVEAVLGERASREMIRTGEERALVSALFEDVSPSARHALEELGYPDDDGAVLISREITQAGKNTCKINGMPATVSILKGISSLLIHIHGQRDSQQLLHSENHRVMIDAYGELEGELADYQAAYEEMCRLREELDSLNIGEAQKAQRIDMLSYQIAEIEAAALDDPGEEEVLVARKKMLGGSESILQGLGAAVEALEGDGELPGISELMAGLVDGIAAAANYMEELEPAAQRLQEIHYELDEYRGDLRRSLDELEFDPRELDEIESRLDELYKLKRKYGGSVAAVLEHLDQAREELEGLGFSEQRAEQLEKDLAAAAKKAVRLAATLTKQRKAAAERFVKKIEEELAFLDMPSVKLTMSRREKELSPDGADDLELLITANVGEEPRPLSKVASGGELARIMLGIKNVLADRDHIDTLIFDEVDAGVSGRAAGKIGQKLAQVSRDRQVICVTHLAQVAAYGRHHLLIHKEVEEGRTFTRVTPLEGEGRVRELARITGGDLLTDTALENARELIAHAEQSSTQS